MSTLNEKLIDYLAEHGLKVSTIDYRHSAELVEEIDDRHENGSLSDDIFNRYLTRYRDKYNKAAGYKTVIVIAAYQALGILEFMHNDRIYPVIIPPTYVYGDMEASVSALVKGYLTSLGYSAEKAPLPNKLLAVRSGLGSYGRNNICYVPGMGSFHRIMAFYTDMPCDTDNWQEVKTMKRCSSCKLCMRNCPTGCISEDRFLIHAENCLTHLNENDGEFPAWLDKNAHNAIVGCMSCQEQCPENKGRMGEAQVLEGFSPEQTAMILKRVPFNDLPAELVAKLERLSLAEYYDVLPRNLGVLVSK